MCLAYQSGSKTIPDKARDIAKQVKANNGAPPKGYKGGRTYKNIPLEDGAQKLPALASFDAVRNRKLLTLHGIHIILKVSIPCKENLVVAFVLNTTDNLRNAGNTFIIAKGSGYKIILHINYY